MFPTFTQVAAEKAVLTPFIQQYFFKEHPEKDPLNPYVMVEVCQKMIEVSKNQPHHFFANFAADPHPAHINCITNFYLEAIEPVLQWKARQTEKKAKPLLEKAFCKALEASKAA